MAETSATRNAKSETAKATAAANEQVNRATADTKSYLSQFELPQSFRQIAERSIDQSREAYGRMRDAAQETVELMEASATRATDTATEINLKTVDFVEANVDAGFELMRKLLKTRDAAEAVELQVAFARQQVETFGNQAKELGAVATRAVQEASEPFKQHVTRSFEQIRSSFPR